MKQLSVIETKIIGKLSGITVGKMRVSLERFDDFLIEEITLKKGTEETPDEITFKLVEERDVPYYKG